MKSNNKPKQSANNKKRIIRDSNSRLVAGTFFGFVLTIFGLSLFCSNEVFAEDSITITIDNPTLNVNVASKNANGTFAKSSDSTISVKTTNATGYTLGIKGNNNPTKLTNGSDSDTNTNSLTSVSSAITEGQFKALTGTAYNGMWGYLPSKYCTAEDGSNNCSTNSDFLPAPTTNGDTLDETSIANSTANEYTLAIGARVDSTQKLGSYSNTYVVYASANAISYSIIYDDNVVANMPTDVNSGQAVSGLVAFSDKTPTRDGYTFVGWCTESGSSITSQATCEAAGGTFYAANSSTTIATATAFNMYAIWSGSGSGGGSGSNCTISGANSITGNMQDAATADTYCDGATGSMTDTRDNQIYTVAKINGNLWMTRNLAIGCAGTGSTYSATVSSKALTSATSNVASNWSTPTALLSAASGSTRTADYTDPRMQCNATYGAWYNYAAASASTITGDSNTNQDEYNICPAGWTLPIPSQMASLYDAYPYLSSFSPVSGGYYNNGSLTNTGLGYWWSATSFDTAYRDYLIYNSSSNYLFTSNNNRYIGYYVRCVRSS